jgi:hypothetical protein
MNTITLTVITTLAAELARINAALAWHRALVAAAHEARDAAFESAGVPVVGYQYDVRELWRYPSADAADRALNALRDCDGAYWAESRAMDIERAIRPHTGQLPLYLAAGKAGALTNIVPAHECVEPWLREVEAKNRKVA